MRRTATLLTVVAGSLALAACTDDPDDDQRPAGTARFATLTPTQRDHAIRVAMGREQSLAATLITNILLDPSYTCAAVEWSGSTVTITPACDTGRPRLSGRMVVLNRTRPGGPPPTGPGETHFESFVATGDPGGAPDLALDGVVRQSGLDVRGDYASTLDGLTVRVAATWTRENAATADETVMAGAMIELDGVGTAAIDGRWSRDPFRGTLELRGADVLQVHLDQVRDTDDGFCLPITIDGEPAGEHCGC